MVYFQQEITKIKQSESKQKISNWVQSLIKICSDRILFLTRAILEEENDWRSSEKKRNNDNSVDSNKLPVHVEKVIELLEFYKMKTLQLSESCTKALQIFSELI